MEEKILVTSEQYDIKRGMKLFFIIVASIGGFIVLVNLIDAMMKYKAGLWDHISSPIEYALWTCDWLIYTVLGILAFIGVICLLIHDYATMHESVGK